MKSAMVKPVVTITSFVLAGIALAFAAYFQANPSARTALPSGSTEFANLSTRMVSAAKNESSAGKNEVFVIMIEPMFFLGVTNAEALGDTPFITPSRDVPMSKDEQKNWILSTHRLRKSREPCVQ